MANSSLIVLQQHIVFSNIKYFCAAGSTQTHSNLDQQVVQQKHHDCVHVCACARTWERGEWDGERNKDENNEC